MNTITEGTLKFRFPGNCQVGKYDDGVFYRNQFPMPFLGPLIERTLPIVTNN